MPDSTLVNIVGYIVGVFVVIAIMHVIAQAFEDRR